MSLYSQEEKIEIFKVLYPLFKQEVYHRRDQILKVASITSGLFLILIIILACFKISGLALRPYFMPIIGAVFIFEAAVLFHLFQHKSRHEEAKRMLINLEEQMGFFNEGIMESSGRFYPDKWKIRALDPGFVVYPVLHGGLIFLLGSLMA
ncbi:MAG: hypothetical protein ACHQYP_02805 [Nitrospiria bacterium]